MTIYLAEWARAVWSHRHLIGIICPGVVSTGTSLLSNLWSLYHFYASVSLGPALSFLSLCGVDPPFTNLWYVTHSTLLELDRRYTAYRMRPSSQIRPDLHTYVVILLSYASEIEQSAWTVAFHCLGIPLYFLTAHALRISVAVKEGCNTYMRIRHAHIA